MDFILIAYVGIMAVGILWVLYRVTVYVRGQRDRDRRWTGDISEDEFAAFLAEFKRNKALNEGGQDPGHRNRAQDGSPSGIEPSSTVSVTRPLDGE